MIDKEYIKEIISRITKKKADGNIKNVRNMEQTDYTCKDCFFFDNGVWECKEERFGRDVSEDDDACTDFEYKEIKVEL